MLRKAFLTVFFIQISLLCFSQNTKHYRVEVPFDNELFLQIHSLGLSVDNITKDQMMVLEIDESELRILKKSKINFSIVINDLEKYYRDRNSGKDAKEILRQFRNSKQYPIPEGFEFGSMSGFCTLDEIYEHLDYMAANYPNLVSPKATTGTLVSIEGRPVFWVKISDNPLINESEPKVLYTALIHSREPGSMQQMLFFMYYLLENYETNDEIKAIINNTELYFIPCINPDGYVYNQLTNPTGGGQWRKNRRINSPDNSYGVDLNRNFGYKWAYDNYGSSSIPSSSLYRGTSAFSEPETQIIRDFCFEHHFDVCINYHTYGKYLLQPWGYVSYLYPPHHQIMQDWERLLTLENYYRFGNPGSLLYLVNGNADDWMYGEQTTKPMCYSFTPEVGTSQDGFWPTIERIIPQCYECLRMNITAAQLAGYHLTLTELSPPTFASHEGFIKFQLKRNGIQNSPVTVLVEALDENFLFIGPSKSISLPDILSTATDSISFHLKSGLKPGDTITYLIKATCEYFETTDTIVKIFGQKTGIFTDQCNTLENWITDDWTITTQNYFSPASSVASASGSSYPNNKTSIIQIAQPINLTDANHAWLEFYTRWELDGGQDFVKCMLSIDNGQNWTNLSGIYTTSNFVTGQAYMPVYAGKQTAWVRERIDLSEFCGNNIKIGFRFQSDASIGKSGFVLDDIKIEKLSFLPTIQEIQAPTGWSSLSGYIIPEETSMDEVFLNNQGTLEIILHNDKFYQPGNEFNTLTDWNSMEGYQVKFLQNTFVQLTGYPETFQYIQLIQGWNLVPVLSPTPVLIANLTTEPSGKVSIIRDAIGQNAFWPDQEQYSLRMLLPGKSYFIYVSDSCKLYY